MALKKPLTPEQQFEITNFAKRDEIIALFPQYRREQLASRKALPKNVNIPDFTLKSPYGDKILLQNTELTLEPNRRQALFGPNSSGKTVLFMNIVKGEIQGFPTHLSVHHCKELEEHELEDTVLNTVIKSNPYLNILLKVEEKLKTLLENTAQDKKTLEDLKTNFDFITTQINSIGGKMAEDKAKKMLRVLGFDEVGQAKLVKELSGGLKMRVALCMAFFIEADLLLMDEPTNHLDFPSVLWLENRLRSYRGSFLLVTHDRELLKNVCTGVLMIDELQIKYYNMVFPEFEKKRDLEAKKKYEEIEKFCKKYENSDPCTQIGRQRLDKKAWADNYHQKLVALQSKFTFPPPVALTLPEGVDPATPQNEVSLINLQDVVFSYNLATGHYIFQTPISFNVRLGTRVGVMGPNGAGKSTFLKLLTHKLKPTSGSVIHHPNFKLAYFGQHSTAELDMEATAMSFMQDSFPKYNVGQLRQHLGKTGIVGPIADTRIKGLSYSQRSCVIFAKLTLESPHLLILDEPTNFLDLESVDSLISACNKYKGALLLVSHNRDFLKKCAKQFLSIVPGRFELYDDLKTAEKATYTFIQEMEAGGKISGKTAIMENPGGGSIHSSQKAGATTTSSTTAAASPVVVVAKKTTATTTDAKPAAATETKAAAAPAAGSDSNNFEVNEKVQAKFSEDGRWYNAVIRGIKGDLYSVYYVDYGNSEFVPISSLRKFIPRDAVNQFVSQIDTAAINKQCGGRVMTVEDKYEEERSKRKTLQEEKGNGEILVDPVDVLPVKTLDGKLHYRTESKKSKLAEAETDEAEKDVLEDEHVLNKSQRREKAKKSKREAKKHEKDLPDEILQEEEETPQAAVLAEVKEELSAEESFENKKNKIAELGMLLLSDPEANIKTLKDMLDICKDQNTKIVKLALLSLLAVFKDIIPGYRIRLPTEKELEMKISKEVKKTRFYESTLLKAYKSYLQKLIIFEKQSVYNQIANRCLCTLLEAVPHFNYRDNLLIAVVRNISSPDEVVRRLCCSTIRYLFSNEGKHGGELTVQAVRLIADHVKAHNCQLHPNAIEVFMSIRFDEDIGKPNKEDEHNKKYKKNNKRKTQEEQNQVQENERKKSKKDMMSKIRDEVSADHRGVTYEPDAKERRKMQTETLSAVFETYFRILRNTMYTIGERTEEIPTSNPGAFGSHPLLAPCLDGLAKFTQQLDLDYMGDLMNYLKKLASSSSSVSNNTKQKNSKLLTVSERLRCCLVAFKVMRSNLNALNVDLQDFFVQLYNLILEYRPGRDSGVILAESLKIMLCDDRHQDMQKAAAFVKRLATFALCFGCAESMSALVTLKTLLQKNVKCRNLLENDAGGGSVSGSIAKYQPYATDPNLSGALATVLWELSLLSKHYHPAISTMATTVSNMNTSQSQTFLSAVTPQQAFADFSLVKESFEPKNESRKLNNKRKRESLPEEAKNVPEIDMVKLSKKLKENFTILRDIKEDERVRMELLQSEEKKPLKKQNNVVKKKLKNPKSKKQI